MDSDRVFEALADPTRRRVVALLGERPHRAGELAGAVGSSAPVMRPDLRVLLHADIVGDERVPEDARVRVFRLRPESLAGVRAWLDQVQAHWSEQLGAFKRHVEQERNP